jgi:hypothetical protein
MPAAMGGATLFSCSLILVTLFVSQVQAGWEMLSPEYGAQRDVVRRQDNQGPKIVIDAGYGGIIDTLVQQYGRSADIISLTVRLLMDRMLQGNNRSTSAHGCFI